MLIGYSQGEIPSVATIGGAGGGRFLNGTQSGLVDGIPARVARLIWYTTAGTTATTLSIPLSFAQERNHRIAVVLGLTLPPGTLMRVRLKDALSNVVAFIDQRAVRFANGSTGAWFVFPVGTPASKLADLVIFNDVNGVASIAANQVFDIGEFAVMPAVDIAIQEDWSDESNDPTETTLTRDSQPASVGRLPYRKVEANLSASSYGQVYSAALEGGMDWAKVRQAFAGDSPVIAIPRWRDASGALVQDLVNATGLFGTARMGKVQHLGDDIYSAGLTFTESPAAN